MSKEKSRLEEHVKQIPSHKRKLHRSLTSLSIKIGKALRESELTKVELEKEIGRHDGERPGEWVDRMFGGGINLSLRTIYKLEEALDAKFIEIPEPDVEEPSRRKRRET